MGYLLLQTVVETREFARVSKLVAERKIIDELIAHIAANPLAGKIIPGCGGIRKMRWQLDKRSGKRGGIRVIYFYYNREAPIFLFTVYAKNKRLDIKASEKKILRNLTKQIVNYYQAGEKNEQSS